ncbi:MAG: thiolase domain-containing protein, partial [Pseudomonadota bacterium]|nr:thiolase domain-containing protein [Pseudomonadota bacterium]
MSGCIVGWAHTKFGKHDGIDIETLIVNVATEALIDAGIAPRDVDEIFIGHFNGGFVMQDFPSSLVLQANKDLRFKPSTRVENACATGTAAIHQGLNAIAAKRSRLV